MSETLMQRLDREDKEFAKLGREIKAELAKINRYCTSEPAPACVVAFAAHNLKQTSEVAKR